MNEPTLWSFVANADGVVKTVMLLLLLASLACWTVILQRQQLFRRVSQAAQAFQQRFWADDDFAQLHSEPHTAGSGLAAVFHAGVSEFNRLRQHTQQKPEQIMQGVERCMDIAKTREITSLEKHLNFLATVGSTAPYVGLFGTVWGIMSSFRALGAVQQASIAMVAPGIAEALIATAIGLFAAIPAVIAYNRLSNQLNQIEAQYQLFQQEMLSILQRQL